MQNFTVSTEQVRFGQSTKGLAGGTPWDTNIHLCNDSEWHQVHRTEQRVETSCSRFHHLSLLRCRELARELPLPFLSSPLYESCATVRTSGDIWFEEDLKRGIICVPFRLLRQSSQTMRYYCLGDRLSLYRLDFARPLRRRSNLSGRLEVLRWRTSGWDINMSVNSGACGWRCDI